MLKLNRIAIYVLKNNNLIKIRDTFKNIILEFFSVYKEV